ncbi:MAG: hypothetical protein JWM69_211 [Candidatus Binatus sp.]|nr:hypothetical protein [Candidatus Binatus sp.]
MQRSNPDGTALALPVVRGHDRRQRGGLVERVDSSAIGAENAMCNGPRGWPLAIQKERNDSEPILTAWPKIKDDLVAERR